MFSQDKRDRTELFDLVTALQLQFRLYISLPRYMCFLVGLLSLQRVIRFGLSSSLSVGVVRLIMSRKKREKFLFCSAGAQVTQFLKSIRIVRFQKCTFSPKWKRSFSGEWAESPNRQKVAKYCPGSKFPPKTD